MRSERALGLLKAHQQRILQTIADARVSFDREDGSQLQALALERWKLVRAMREYQLFKHVEIFDPLIGRNVAPRCDIARLLKQRCLDMAQRYEDHVRRWALDGPNAHWPEYRRDALALADGVERHLSEEWFEVQGLLLGAARTRAP